MNETVEIISPWALPDLDRARDRCFRRNGEGISCTLHVLDEYTKTKEEVNRVHSAYLETIRSISADGLDATVSVKLSSLGALFDGGIALERTFDLCREAKNHGVGFEIDMEGRALVGAAIEATSACRRKGLPVTLALQAYLDRTPGDLRLVLALGAVPRLVKGAYQGDVGDFGKIQERFLDIVRETAGYDVDFHVGTHDPDLLGPLQSLMEGHRERITFGFLMGLADRTMREMAVQGWQVSEYVPFGRDPGPYVARRERYIRELGKSGRRPVP
jgi:proline dehydrogenase